jgi:hypothetical protein
MALIQQVVQKTLASGYLACSTETELRCLFRQYWDLEDMDALNQLQEAMEAGKVRREMGQLKLQIVGDRS